jgi:hypothetical protein
MHGTEQCKQKLRALRLSAPRRLFSPPAGSMPQSTPQSLSCPGPVARIGLSLACNSFRFLGPHSRVNVPGLILRSLTSCFRRPFGFSAPLPIPVRPEIGRFHASGPLRHPQPAWPAANPASTPLRDCYFPLDQSVQQDRCRPARLPNPPDVRSLPAAVFYH